MSEYEVLSDQLYYWSDQDAESIDVITAAATQSPAAQTAESQGPGHGPKYYLSISRTGQSPQMDYVPQEYHDQVEEYLANHRLVREIIGEISRINQELLRRRENL
jgi:hypothetical protein